MDEIPVLLRTSQTGMTVVTLVPGIFHNVIPVLDGAQRRTNTGIF